MSNRHITNHWDGRLNYLECNMKAVSSLPLLIGTVFGAIINKLPCIFIWISFSKKKNLQHTEKEYDLHLLGMHHERKTMLPYSKATMSLLLLINWNGFGSNWQKQNTSGAKQNINSGSWS